MLTSDMELKTFSITVRFCTLFTSKLLIFVQKIYMLVQCMLIYELFSTNVTHAPLTYIMKYFHMFCTCYLMWKAHLTNATLKLLCFCRLCHDIWKLGDLSIVNHQLMIFPRGRTLFNSLTIETMRVLPLKNMILWKFRTLVNESVSPKSYNTHT